MFQDPSEAGIRESIREIHFFLSGYIEGQAAKGEPEKWEGLDPTHLEALDCVLKYLDEWADIKTEIEKGKGDPKNERESRGPASTDHRGGAGGNEDSPDG